MSDRRQAIQDAFLGDLRTVILIDDQFPSYDDACAGKAHERSETKRAVALGKGFRGLGFTCEVENNPVPPSEHVQKGDLIVLDYHLTGDHDDGSKARQVLRELLGYAQQHLVIVYTSDPQPRSVWLRIMASLAGNESENPAEFDNDEQEDEFKEWKRDRNYELSEEPFIQFLKRDKKWVAASLRELEGHGLNPGKLRKFASRVAHMQVKGYGGTYRPKLHRLEVSGKGSTWIRCDNLFVVVVKKGDEEDLHSAEKNAATVLRDHLLDALCEWNPSFLRVMLNFARHRIVEQGFIGDDRVLKDPTSEAGWLMFMEGGTPEERKERVTALYGRLFEDLVVEALDQIEKFSAEHADSFVGQYSASSTNVSSSAIDSVEVANQSLAAVRRRAGVDENVKDESILHSLNDYLAFEPSIPTFLRTGTVFIKLLDNGRFDGDPAICTTPDCDLVPRVPKSGWGKRLSPHIPVLYRPVSMSKEFAEALTRAEESRSLFRKVDNISQVLELFTKEGGHRRPEMIFVEDQGRISPSGEFRARGVHSPDTTLELQAPQRYKVIGQLRARYAMRLLHETGHHLSRIGVDFVDWPPRER
jgi:Response receiver domain